MEDLSSTNKRIAKNSIYLYVRMLFVTCISLYTSRVVLEHLGISDFGLYNVIGGIIGMLGYVNTLLSGSTSRFLTVDLGRGIFEELKNTFSCSNTLSIISVLILLVLGETVGLWFVNNELNIEPDRMVAANWVYQFSLFSTIFSVLQTPYSAIIIAHEDMSVFAYIGIIDAVLRLSIALALVFSHSDRLILYGFLLLISFIIIYIIHLSYCLSKYSECSLKLHYEKNKFREMLSFSGWNMIMAFANILNTYGLNILLNIFYGTVVNAARGVALQVNSLLSQLSGNFQTASRPQIMKYYAQNNIKEMHNLICNTSKYSVCLLFCIVIPLWFNIDDLLSIWLVDVPEYSNWFVRIMIINSLLISIDLPIGMGIQAVGKMKLPNLTSAFLYLSICPITYFVMKAGASVVISYCVYISVAPFILCADLFILKKYTNFSIINFVKKCIVPVLVVGILCSFSVAVFSYLNVIDLPFKSIINTLMSIFIVALIEFYSIIPANVRSSIINKIKKRI